MVQSLLQTGFAMGCIVSKYRRYSLFIDPGIPWDNGSIESFKYELRDELLA